MTGKVLSRNPLDKVRVRRGEEYPVDKIRIDMTGWNNGVHRDESHVNAGVYPYMIEFRDAERNMQGFMVDEMNADSFVRLLDTVKKKMGAKLFGETSVEIICPQECLAGHRNEVRVKHGCRAVCSVYDLNERGMEALNFIPTRDGVVQRRLETVLDDTVHAWIMGCQTDAVYRKSPDSFPHSIRDYRDEEMSHADDVGLRNRSRFADSNENYQLD